MLLALLLLSSACTTTTYEEQLDGRTAIKITRKSFLTKVSAAMIEKSSNTNGVTLMIKGLLNDQTSAAAAITEAAVKAAIEGAKKP